MAFALLLALVWPSAAPRAVEPAGSFWLAPASLPTGRNSTLSTAIDDLAAGRAAEAVPTLTRATRDVELGGYALLYLGRAQLTLNKTADAATTAERLLSRQPSGYLGEAALWLAANVAEAANDWPGAIKWLQVLAASKSLDPERVNLHLGRAASIAHDRELALATFTRVYYDFPLSPEAAEAAIYLANLSDTSVPPTRDTILRDLGRAQQLFSAKRYADARAAFAAVRNVASGDDRALADLRIAACDYSLKHYAVARVELLPLIAQTSSRQPEAEFLDFSALRELGRPGGYDEYVARARAFADAHPTLPLAEETLNNLATHYILTDDDAKAAAVLAELYQRFPAGVHASRAAWRAGWWAYKTGEYGEAIRIFEAAATTFPRDDYRPPWLYWAARAHERSGERDAAIADYRLVISAYRNSYYGRQATRMLGSLVTDRVSPVRYPAPSIFLPVVPPPNAGIIRSLLAADLLDDAVFEVRKAQLEYGTSPMLEATIAYAQNRKGDLRPAITTMRRAYPQFLADGGDALPLEIRRVIFPLVYGDLIAKYATARQLDPYLMAALVAQESTFQADVRSSAGAWGLMQIEPGTGRQYAAKLGIRPFNTARLTQPETNVRIGMATFADLMKKFGNAAAALAAYNAGDSRVSRWRADRPGFEQDEFIDDIPFPETQNYVKRILGTAEDYRILYRGLNSTPQIIKKAGG